MPARKLIFLIIAAFTFRLVFFVALAPWLESSWYSQVVVADADLYNNLGLHLALDGFFPFLETFRPPGYPLFISLFYKIFGLNSFFVLLGQIILDCLTAFLIYKTSRLLSLREKTSFLVAYLYAFNPLAAVYTLKLLPETFLVFLLILATFFFVKGIQVAKVWPLTITSLTLSLAALTKPIVLYLPIVFLVSLFIFKRQFKVKVLSSSLIIIALYLLSISPWLIRNQVVYGTPSFSVVQGFNLINYNAAYLLAQKEQISTGQARKFLKRGLPQMFRGTFYEAKIYQERALAYITKFPLAYLILHLKGSFLMLLSTPKNDLLEIFQPLSRHTSSLPVKSEKIHSSEIGQTVRQESFFQRFRRVWSSLKGEYYLSLLILVVILEYLLAVLGFSRFFKTQPSLFLLAFIFFYFFALTGPVGSVRFRLPIIPFYLILAGFGIEALTSPKIVLTKLGQIIRNR